MNSGARVDRQHLKGFVQTRSNQPSRLRSLCVSFRVVKGVVESAVILNSAASLHAPPRACASAKKDRHQNMPVSLVSGLVFLADSG